MSIENIPAFTPRMTEVNPDLDAETLAFAISYSYDCNFCGAPAGQSCIWQSDVESNATPPRRARFPHASRGSDYIPKAKVAEAMQRSADLIHEVFRKVINEMTEEALAAAAAPPEPVVEEWIEF